MLRPFVAVLTLLAVFSAASPSGAAYPVSGRNPYRSFNISGVNYGSQRWERQRHGHAAWSPARRSAKRWR